jgi:hypothetical protein
MTVMDYTGDFGDKSIKRLITELNQRCEQANKGNLDRVEAVLTAHAYTLDAIFHKLARKAIRSAYLDHLEVLLRMGLRAQGQCRATIETLALIKNPPAVAFVRQANIAGGLQQVNNQSRISSGTHAGKSEIEQIRLLEDSRSERVDARTACKTKQDDRDVEALGTINRSADNRRKGKGFAQCVQGGNPSPAPSDRTSAQGTKRLPK